MRGKDSERYAERTLLRITPACAGKSGPHTGPGKPSQDHPRVCGEKARMAVSCFAIRGSPPRVRGKAVAACDTCQARGITPACAGKRALTLNLAALVKDHPRVCGEKCITLSPTFASKGSPPRVRGKGACGACEIDDEGITPACAGKSKVVNESVRIPQDHPRVCGEKSPWLKERLSASGSPPRVRGKG